MTKEESIFVIIHANKVWVKLFFTKIELARNYIAFRCNGKQKEQSKNVFIVPHTGAKYEIIELENYSEAIKRE